MLTYLNHEDVPNFVKWLEHKIKRIPKLAIYYRSDDRQDFESLFHDSYPMTIFVCLIMDCGLINPDIQALFIMEQVGDRVKLAIKIHPSLAEMIEPVINEMHRDWPETTTTKGRYRLTEEEIDARKTIVIKAKEIKQEHPKKYWKEIAIEMDIPESTLRHYRHDY